MFRINPFSYTPNSEYNFSIVPNSNNKKLQPTEPKNIEKNIDLNLNYVQSVYNTLINSDIVIRNFLLKCENEEYRAFIVYIDGMVNNDLINRFILEPLMLRNNNNIFSQILDEETNSSDSKSKIIIKKVKPANIEDYIYKTLIPQNSLKKYQDFNQIFDGINSGNCALFVDTVPVGFDIDVKGLQQRNVDKPANENIIKGPQEAFVENIRNNTALLRRRINNENLVIENVSIGNITKTKTAICYIKDIANENLVSEVKFRLNNLKIDSLLSTGQLEQLIEDNDKMRNSTTIINRKT